MDAAVSIRYFIGSCSMPDIRQVLNDEIRRLARKEVKNILLPMIKQLGEQKRLISDLKKQIAVLEKRVPAKVASVKTEAVDCDAKKLRLNAAGIVKLRNKLGLSQGKLAELIGVSTHTVSMWEIGRVSPRAGAKAAICALRTIGKRELKRRLAELAEASDNKSEN